MSQSDTIVLHEPGALEVFGAHVTRAAPRSGAIRTPLRRRLSESVLIGVVYGSTPMITLVVPMGSCQSTEAPLREASRLSRYTER